MNNDAFIIGGLGTVGKATARTLDIPYYFDLKDSNITLKEGAKKLFCFICLPTDTDEKGGQEKSIKVIRDYVSQMKEIGGRNIFVIRSTVIPGTAKGIAKEFGVMVASNPELLTEATWKKDADSPRMTIIGADDVPTRNALLGLWKNVKTREKIVTDTVTAETLKYAFNTFFTTKVVWANQLYDICEINGANYNVIKEAIYKHPWGTHHHLKVFHKGGRGAGGKCLRKDTEAFAKYSNLELLETVQKLNTGYLRKSKKK